MDSYKIRITKQAKEHLALIRDYIALELKEPTIAKKMLELLKKRNVFFRNYAASVKCIDEQPWHDLGFRKIQLKNYYIYFWIDENKNEVQIIAVIYAKRDQTKQLEKL